MAPKKMTLQEFFTDETLGGSWADDDIDISSISVPIEKARHSGGMSGYDSLRSGYGTDSGPPYIVKLLNLPITANDDFVEDLFRSRFTSFIKFKIVVDPVSNILETHVIKKVAFVELHSFQDLSKVTKWQDLYYQASRRVVVEAADFGDFKHCMNFNQDHQAEILRIENDFLSGKSRPPPRRESLPRNELRPEVKPIIKKSEPKPKVNPFGLAKPVDIVSRSQKIDKKLISINHTTIRTLGPDADIDFDSDKDGSRPKKSQSVSAKPQSTKPQVPANSVKSNFKPAPVPDAHSRPNGVSIAQLLSNKPEEFPRSSSAQNKNSPKPTVLKPVILKKKQSHVDKELVEEKVPEEPKETEPETGSVSETRKSEPQEPSTKMQARPKSSPDSVKSEESKSEKKSKSRQSNGRESSKEKPKEDRPNFKKHFDELSKRPFEPKARSRANSGHSNSPRPSSGRGRRGEKSDKEHKHDDKIDLNFKIKDEAASDAKVTQVIENSVRQRTKSLSEKAKSGRGRSGRSGRSHDSHRGRRSPAANSETPEPRAGSKSKDSKRNDSNGSVKESTPRPRESRKGKDETKQEKQKEKANSEASQSPTEGSSETPNGGRGSQTPDGDNHESKSRGRGRGGRSRGRARARGNARGNVFNLHYVRKHDEPEAASKPAESTA